jgi:hypothetical protein
MAAWVPRGVDPSTREVLIEGVPKHMKPAVIDFLRPYLASETLPGNWSFRRRELIRYDLEARLHPSYLSRLDGRAWPGFVEELTDDELLDLADWIIHRNNSSAANALGYVLEAGSSAWTIGTRQENKGLVRRMPVSVQEAVESTLRAGAPGKLLGEAWAAAYGRVPDPEEAYEKAIKAVEEASAFTVTPKNSGATLGTLFRDMKAQAWTLDLPGRSADVVVPMVEALWTGQESRHGGNGYRRPTQAEAETAVTLAVALVQLFVSGSAARRS